MVAGAASVLANPRSTRGQHSERLSYSGLGVPGNADSSDEEEAAPLRFARPYGQDGEAIPKAEGAARGRRCSADPGLASPSWLPACYQMQPQPPNAGSESSLAKLNLRELTRVAIELSYVPV